MIIVRMLRQRDSSVAVHSGDLCLAELLYLAKTSDLQTASPHGHETTTVKMKKCVFGAEDCVYLGYRIGQGGVRPEES